MRQSKHPIDPFFTERFSPRAFGQSAIEPLDLEAILEAASTAPSCFNDQPWRFVLAPHERILPLLAEANAAWCAPLETFVLLCATPRFSRNDQPNAYSRFDCGAAWGYMTLEAHRRGIFLHAMAGFDAEAARESLALGDLDPVAIIAFGREPEPAEFTPRKPLSDLVLRR